ncbi:hypothetical protein NHX12_027838, partial [Muraenolepis orangiensis]
FSPISSAEEFDDDDKIEVDEPTVMNCSTAPVIPKVRIKTIKTSSGQIKRTVTRVLPVIDAEGKSGEGSNNLAVMVSSVRSSTTPNTVSPSLRKTSLPNTVASSAICKAANGTQQQTIMVPASSLANAKLVPKTVHLTNLNLLPKAISNTTSCISIPSRGYKCQECGDSFALDKSLSQHLERRSVRIEVTCNHCSKNLVFYNKCSLLSHAREHKDKGVVMQCSHLILKPIPTDQMITTSAPANPRVTSSSTVLIAQTQNSTPATTQEKTTAGGAQTSVISAPNDAPLMAAMPLEDEGTKHCRQSLKCIECNETFQDESSLVLHYQHAVEFNAQKTCSICQMLLPNQCSFVSHQRIHQHKSPYICPECGTSCRSVHFQSHVTKNCLHYTRRVGYRCVHCNVIFGDVASLKSHIQNTHCEVFYKCPSCPMAFKSAQAMHSHGYTQHPGAKIGEPKLIHKCSMCDTVFTQPSLLSAHFDQHVANHKVSVFKCPDCSMLYAQKQLMLDHIKVIHGTLKTVEGPPNLGINLPLNSKKPGPLSLKTTNSNCNPGDRQGPQGYTCSVCDGVFTTREVFVSHVRRDHGKILKKHPCKQCDKSFSSTHSLCRHNRLKHKGLRKIYTCPHCPPLSQPFTKRVLLDQHIQLLHDIKEPESKSLDPDDVESQPNKNAGSKRKPEEGEEDDDDKGSPGLHRRGPNGQPPPPPPLKKPKVTNAIPCVRKGHKCAVCGFAGAEDAGAFRLHITQHSKSGGSSSHQCQECGLCYTSHRSLSRHLFIVHRLKDHHNLARRGRTDATSASAPAAAAEDQSGVADENAEGQPSGTRCKVCGKVFETEGHLKTHMRTHGMAYIKAKRLSAVEK